MRFQSIRLLAIPGRPSKELVPTVQVNRSRLRRLQVNPIRRLYHDLSIPTTPNSSSLHSTQPQPSTNHIPHVATLASKPTNLSKTPIGIKITPSVIAQIERVRAIDKKPDEVLRLSVESGGCHGYQYKMEFTDDIEPDDFVFTAGNRNGMLVIDEDSLDLMDGSTIDFATELIGSSFRVLDNPHSAGKGCGCGVSWQLK